MTDRVKQLFRLGEALHYAGVVVSFLQQRFNLRVVSFEAHTFAFVAILMYKRNVVSINTRPLTRRRGFDVDFGIIVVFCAVFCRL